MGLEGSQLGQYRLLRLLGSGGMGEVYLAEDPRIGQQVAIKVNKAEISSYPKGDIARDAVRLFQREAKAIAKLDHPHILPLFSYDEAQVNGMTLIYIVMPFRREGSFADWLHEGNSDELLPVQDVVYFIKQASDALQYAHNHQILHQDVKPSNFLIRTNENNPDRPDLLLSDFGIAKLNSATTSVSYAIRGTPVYMAPEQWSGEPVPATDQYALAVMTYELLTGRPPFTGRQEQVMYQHFNLTPQPPRTLNPALPKDVNTVLLKALEKNPADRFLSIAAFANALQQATQSGNTSTVIKAPGMSQPSAGHLEPTVPATDPQELVETITSSKSRSSAGTIPVTHSHAPHTSEQTSRRAPISRNRAMAIALVVLALLVVSASAGTIYFQALHRPTNNSPDIAATTHANDATSFAATATSQSSSTNATAQSAQATATQQANNTNATATSATPTISSTPTFPPPNATLVLNDPLSANDQGYGWETQPDATGVCQFTGGVYQVSETKDDTREYCPAYNTSFGSKFAYEVQMILVQGDVAGPIFRDATHNISYFWRFRQDGSYDLTYYEQNVSGQLVIDTATPFRPGFNQSNLLQVIVTGDSIELFVNNQFIRRVSIGTYGQGYIGVFVKEMPGGSPTEAIFSNAKVWTF